MADDEAAAAAADPVFDTTVSHSARIWNYWLGGKDNYAADREAGDKVAAMLSSIVAQARAHPAFLRRSIPYLAGEAIACRLQHLVAVARPWRRRHGAGRGARRRALRCAGRSSVPAASAVCAC